MAARLAADAVLLVHLAFILFAVFGGVLLLWRRWLAVLHLPALAWGIWIEATHGICPLTRLENHYRALAGDAGYGGGFIEHYLVPMIYPAALTPDDQRNLAIAFALWSVAVYGVVAARCRRLARVEEQD